MVSYTSVARAISDAYFGRVDERTRSSQNKQKGTREIDRGKWKKGRNGFRMREKSWAARVDWLDSWHIYAYYWIYMCVSVLFQEWPTGMRLTYSNVNRGVLAETVYVKWRLQCLLRTIHVDLIADTSGFHCTCLVTREHETSVLLKDTLLYSLFIDFPAQFVSRNSRA